MSKEPDAVLAGRGARFSLGMALEEVAQGTASEATYAAIVRAYRRLALANVLTSLDIKAFQHGLMKSALAYYSYQQQVIAGSVTPGEFRCTSKAIGFSHALAAADLVTAQRIAQDALDQHQPRLEYEDNFLRDRLQHILLLNGDDEVALRQLIDRWAIVLEGGDSAYFDVSVALVERDQALWDKAFEALLERRAEVLLQWRRMPSYEAVMDAAESPIFVEGLGVLQLAKLRGLVTAGDYRFIPDLTRLDAIDSLPDDSWLRPDG